MNLKKLSLLTCCLFFVSCTANNAEDNKDIPSLSHQTLAESELMAANGNSTIAPLYNLQLTKLNLIFLAATYYDLERLDWKNMTAHAIDALQNNVPEVVAHFDRKLDQKPTKLNLKVNSHSTEFDLTQATTLLKAHRLCADVFNFVMQHVTEKQETANLEYAMINGMFATLDPHTNLMPPRIFDDMMTMNGGFAGLGFVVGLREEKLVIISPMEDAPAWRAGLKAGDVILQVDGEATENMPLQDAVDKMRGKAGTQVKLLVNRKSWTEPKEFELTRENIQVRSVTSKALKTENIGYLKIKAFEQTTTKNAKSMLEDLQKTMPKMRGLIVDLRNNTGGLLTQSIEISELFLQKDQLIVSVEDLGATQHKESKASKNPIAREYPIVVLINGGSASASEIVSGALQYHQRAIIVGEQSFGKGSVQIMRENHDKSATKVTTTQYLTPGDVSIQGVGIVPDIILRPVFVDKTGVFLFPTDKVQREATLERSIQSSKTTLRHSFRELAYLYKDNEEEEKAAKELGLSTYDIRSTEDYTEDDEIRFAINLLKQAKSPKRNEVLEASKTYFDLYEKKHQKELAKALEPLGISWNPPKNNDAPCQQFEWGLRLNQEKLPPNTPLTLTAGETVKLGLWVKNNCETQGFSQFAAITKSNNGSFDEREFIFGNLPPKQEKFWDLELKIPKNADSRDDLVTLRFFNAGEELTTGMQPNTKIPNLADNQFFATTLSIPKPAFSYTYTFDDSKAGNGDGRLQPGESIDMQVNVKNISHVDAEQVSVSLKNNAGKAVLLTKGRDTKSTLKANQTASFKLQFDIRDFTQEPLRSELHKVLQSNTLDLTFGLNALGYGVKLAENFKLALAPAPATDSSIPTNTPSEQPSVQFHGTTHATQETTYNLKATLTDNDALHDYQVFVWNLDDMNMKIEKLDYGLLEGNSKTIAIQAPLQRGNNTIVVIARDKRKIETMALYHVLAY